MPRNSADIIKWKRCSMRNARSQAQENQARRAQYVCVEALQACNIKTLYQLPLDKSRFFI